MTWTLLERIRALGDEYDNDTTVEQQKGTSCKVTRLLELIYTVIEGPKQSGNSVVGDVFVVVVVVM